MRTHIIIALCAVAALAAPGAVTGSLTLENGERQCVSRQYAPLIRQKLTPTRRS